MPLVWVTGAKGFIGRHLARALARQGARVAGIGHGSWSEDDALRWGISRWVNGDVAHSGLDYLASEVGTPDTIFHVAGGSSVGFSLETPEEDFRRTVVATTQLLEWVRLRDLAVRLTLASSAAVYGSGHDGPIQERAPLRPFSPYGYHKRMAELQFESYARHFGLRTVTVRMFSVYGPLLRKQVLWDLCRRLASDDAQPVVLGGTGRELRDWLHVEDAVDALIRVSSAKGTGEAINAASGQGTSVAELAALVCAAWSPHATIKFSGGSRSGDPRSLVADVGQISSLGFAPRVLLAAGVREYVEWFRQAGGASQRSPAPG
jgi:UDP-glucose 4-epimerase